MSTGTFRITGYIDPYARPSTPTVERLLGVRLNAVRGVQHAGDDDVFVRVSASTDRWTRGGWCFETLVDKEGQRHNIVERVSSPKREVRTCMMIARREICDALLV